MSSRSILSVLACVFVLSGLFVPGAAEAKRQHEVRYPFERVWNAALRMLRVDMRLPITDRDPDTGYMLFEYIDQDRRYPGSIEVITSERDKRPLVTVIIGVSGMPSYVEQMMLDKLDKKLNAEYGAPMDPPKEEKPPAKEPEKEPEAKPNEDVAPAQTASDI